MKAELLVQVSELRKYFPVGISLFGRPRNLAKAVDGVSLDIVRGETYALVGESGSGKTTTGRLILRLLEPTSGTVLFDGQDIFRLTEREMNDVRQRTQIIHQDPLASLNPRKTVRQVLEVPYEVHTSLSKDQVYDKVLRLLERVELTPPETFLGRYPHELSGGQRQRICIARAIALSPSFIVADEPVSALDVSVRGQIISLLKELQTDIGLSYLFISHDLAVVKSIGHRVAVMYLGRIVEAGGVLEILSRPLHPYTQTLLSAVPILNPDKAKTRKRIVVGGDVPSPMKPPSGCHFHPRCPYAMEKCKTLEPRLTEVDGRLVACHLYD